MFPIPTKQKESVKKMKIIAKLMVLVIGGSLMFGCSSKSNEAADAAMREEIASLKKQVAALENEASANSETAEEALGFEEAKPIVVSKEELTKLYGKIEKNVYKNETFKFQITVPDSWKIHENPVKSYMLGEITDLGEDKDGEKKETLELANLGSYNVLSATKYPLDYDEAPNSALIIMVENIASAGVDSIEVYLEALQYGLDEAGLSFDVVDSQVDKTSDNEVGTLAISVDADGVPLIQNYSAVKYGDHMVVFVTTVGSEEELDSVAEIMETLADLES